MSESSLFSSGESQIVQNKFKNSCESSTYSESGSNNFNQNNKKLALSKLKNILKGIEDFISNNLNENEKKIFVEQFRKIIVENEKQILLQPTASFIVSKFEKLDKQEFQCKDKVIKAFSEYEQQEKMKNSKLKYW